MRTTQMAAEEASGAFCWAFLHPEYWVRFEMDAMGWAMKFMPLFE